MALDDDIATLGRAPLLSLLDRDALRLLAFAAEHRRLRAGDVLFRAGDRADGGYVVTRGVIDLLDAAGTPVFAAEPGALIGRHALFVRGQRAATAMARVESGAMRISISLMRRVLEEFPQAAVAMREEIAADLTDLTARLAVVGERLLALDGLAEEPPSRG